jgi:hypothetical protein
VTSVRDTDFQPAIVFSNSSHVTLQRCTGTRLGGVAGTSAVVGLVGALVRTTVRENAFTGPVGVGNVVKETFGLALTTLATPVLTQSLDISNNFLSCSQSGISFTGPCTHTLDTRLSNNVINNCFRAGIVALGFVPVGSSLEVNANVIHAAGNGIVVGTSGTQVNANTISRVDETSTGNGIVLAIGVDKTGLDQCHVIGNRIASIGGIGLSVEAPVKSAMIKNNFIADALHGGIVMAERSSAKNITVENNHISNIAPGANVAQTSVVGIQLVDTHRGEVAGNSISGVGLQASNNRCVGIQIFAPGSFRIAGNTLAGIGPVQGNAQTSAGIEIVGTFEELDIVENNVRRSASAAQVDGAEWHGVLITGARTSPPGLNGIFTLSAVKTNTFFMLFADRLLSRLIGTEKLTLLGNVFDVYGSGSAVRAVLNGPCTFSGNRTRLAGRNQDQPAVSIVAGAAVLNANNIQSTPGEKTIVVNLSNNGPFTVLGNITTHSIDINGNALDVPWKPLNVQTT